MSKSSGASNENEETREELLEKLQKLEEQDKLLDEQLAEFEKAGVKENDTVAIMTALHEYNEVKDAVQTIFGYLSSLTSCTISELHEKYNVPK